MVLHSILYILGLLGYLFCAYAVFVLGWTVWKRKRHSFETKLLDWLASWRKTKGFTKPLPLWSVLFSVMISCVLVWGMSVRRWPIVTDHNIRILNRVTSRQWWIVDDEHPRGFMYYACSDFDNNAWIKSGYFAKRATWEIHDDCNSIRAKGLEFDYDWKPDGTAKTIQEEGYE